MFSASCAAAAVEIQVRQVPQDLRFYSLGLTDFDAVFQDLDGLVPLIVADQDIGHERIHGKILRGRLDAPPRILLGLGENAASAISDWRPDRARPGGPSPGPAWLGLFQGLVVFSQFREPHAVDVVRVADLSLCPTGDHLRHALLGFRQFCTGGKRKAMALLYVDIDAVRFQFDRLGEVLDGRLLPSCPSLIWHFPSMFRTSTSSGSSFLSTSK